MQTHQLVRGLCYLCQNLCPEEHIIFTSETKKNRIMPFVYNMMIVISIDVGHSNLNDNSKMMISIDHFLSYYCLVGFKREEICRLHWSESIYDWKDPRIIENCFIE